MYAILMTWVYSRRQLVVSLLCSSIYLQAFSNSALTLPIIPAFWSIFRIRTQANMFCEVTYTYKLMHGEDTECSLDSLKHITAFYISPIQGILFNGSQRCVRGSVNSHIEKHSMAVLNCNVRQWNVTGVQRSDRSIMQDQPAFSHLRLS